MLYTYQKILRMHSPRLYSRTSQSWGRQLLPAAWSLQNNWRTEWKCGWSAVCSSVSGRRRSGQIWLSLYRKCTVKSEHSIIDPMLILSFSLWENSHSLLKSQSFCLQFVSVVSIFVDQCLSTLAKYFFRGFLNLTPHRIQSISFKVTFINKALLTNGCSEKWPPLFSLEM